MNRLAKTVKVICLTFCGVISSNCSNNNRLSRSDWADDVKLAVNDFITQIDKKIDNQYVVFDFDNTTSIFDVTYNLGVYMLEKMAFEIHPDNLRTVLSTGLKSTTCRYNEIITDIVAAYRYLYNKYGPFSSAGLSDEKVLLVKQEDMWKEFATKMGALSQIIDDNESIETSYSWVTYWFTGMNAKKVYDLSYKSNAYFAQKETYTFSLDSPNIESEYGHCHFELVCGLQVTENIKELMRILHDCNIKIWICSGSFVDVVRAAIDYFNLHPYVTGLIGMDCKTNNGIFINQYNDVTTRYALSQQNNEWSFDSAPLRCIATSGKVEAIEKILLPKYNAGPLAGFMDSTGDYNFCTEFKSLKLVVCFNRADRAITDGGGLIAEIAVYQRDYLHYNLKTANENGDTFYVLQGRDENRLRSFRNSNKTIRYNETEEKLFKNNDNITQLNYFINNRLTTSDILNTFVIHKDKDDPSNLLHLEYGFFNQYNGYHSR